MVIVLAWPVAMVGQTAVPVGAFVGAISAAFVVSVVANAAGGHNLTSLLLAGAAVASILNAAVWVLLTFDDKPLNQVVAWLLGSYAGRGWPDVYATAPLMGLALIMLVLLSRPLDALGQGEDAARVLGLPIRIISVAVLLAGSLATAAAVAAGGVVGFVGLVAPYLARRVVGNKHLRLIPASALLGASLLILADTGSRIPVPELPVGVLTALLGGPFFLWILKEKR
jgi:iron complex transport system permease protein